ncbi:MAG: WbuC family cupin fold metalloprotein [Spongiibacteraceae bacterium]|nr:WbuC family cupin fold metalloprotein [Spongiibacteraceae bacterium]
MRNGSRFSRLIADKGFRRDDSGKSLAYFALTTDSQIDGELVEQFQQDVIESGSSNARICLHQGADDLFHNMVILEQRNSRYFRPHQHLDKAETCQMIKGELGLFIFDQQGGIKTAQHLSTTSTAITRIGTGSWHTLLPISDFVLYHESKPGPFISNSDSQYPDWAPDGENTQTALNYQENLYGYLAS